MHGFTRGLLTEWRKLELPFENKTLVVAVSGGADSVGLLLGINDLRARKKLSNRFVVAHFNHRLRGEDSERDAEFVKELCVRFEYEFALGGGEAVSTAGNVEQNARCARYDFLRRTAENLRADAVLTAHTVNDQAETFLINLIRGSGAEGLSGMRAVRSLKSEVLSLESRADSQENDRSRIRNSEFQINLVRPLLNWATRRDTEDFCHLNEIEYRYDTMNEDTAFRRVRVRKVLLLLLEDFNPKIVETLARTANLLRLEIEKGEEQFQILNSRLQTDKEFLILSELRSLAKLTLYAVLREWLADKRGNLRGLELKHLEAIERLIFSRKSGKTAELPAGASVVKEDGKLLFKNFEVEK